MVQHLLILLFLTGVIPLNLSVLRKYYLIQQGETWSDAQAYCRAHHEDLAIIQSNEDVIRFQQETERQHFSSVAWIGLYNDINSWHWSMGNEPLGNMTLWRSGEPNNHNGVESCGLMTSTEWNDMPCTEAWPFVCFDGNKTGNDMYVYVSDALSWSEAQSYCRQHHTDLASSRDSTEQSIIGGVIPGSVWFGLVRDTWKWPDQTVFSPLQWESGEPNNYGGKESCGCLSNGEVNDFPCSSVIPFFCYSVITRKQQLVQVKVQSDQDVTDPSVKAAILEQVKQKLKDHGVAENVKVKWKEQSDGKVFSKLKEKKQH